MILQSLYLSPVDLQKIEGYSCYQSAWRAFRGLLAAMGKQPHHRITIAEYCRLEGVDQQEVLTKIQTTRLPRVKNYGGNQPQLFT